MSGIYSTYRWMQARKRFLRERPICVLCEQRGIVAVADTVDHKIPHKGNETLMWDEANWQATCKRCHDSRKAKIERGDKVLPHASWGGEFSTLRDRPFKPVPIQSHAISLTKKR